VDPPAVPGVGRPEERSVERGGIAQQVVGLGTFDGALRTGQQAVDVDAHQRRRQESDRREHAEPAADVGRHVERRDAVTRGQFAERSARRIGCEDQVPRRRCA
jgi:hypothetical protein